LRATGAAGGDFVGQGEHLRIAALSRAREMADLTIVDNNDPIIDTWHTLRTAALKPLSVEDGDHH
jgi:hypothetical protein